MLLQELKKLIRSSSLLERIHPFKLLKTAYFIHKLHEKDHNINLEEKSKYHLSLHLLELKLIAKESHEFFPEDGVSYILNKYREMASSYTNEFLVDLYNEFSKTDGEQYILGMLIAMDESFQSRFGKSPIEVENNIVSLKGEVIYSSIMDDYFQFEKN